MADRVMSLAEVLSEELEYFADGPSETWKIGRAHV